MSAIAWSTIEKAIHAWVVAASGLAATHVIWEYEGPRPSSKPYIAMTLPDVDHVGHDWKIKDDAPDPEEGLEMRIRARGHRVVSLKLECFGADRSGNAPLQLLEEVLSGLTLYHDDLDDAGVGIGETRKGQFQRGDRGGSILEPRAIAEVALHLGSEVEKRTDYIARVQMFITPKSATGVDLDEVEIWSPDPPEPPPET